MTLSELIKELQIYEKESGDLPVCTPDGEIDQVDIARCLDGVVCYPYETPDEVVVEIWTR